MRVDDVTRIVQYVSQQGSPKTSVLFILAIASGISPVTYIKPSYADTPPYNLPDNSIVKTLQVISTWFPTTSLLYLACLDFITTRSQYIAPSELSDILQGLTPEEIRRMDWAIGLLSGISAIPLTTPLVKFPLVNTENQNIDIPLNIVLVISILLANGIAHLKPLQTIINHPWYGAPFTVIKVLTRRYKRCRMTPEEKKIQEISAKEIEKSQTLNNYLTETLLTKKFQLIDDCFARKSVGYEIKLSKSFNEIHCLNDSSLILKLAAYKYQITDQRNTSITWKQRAYNYFLNSVSQIGAALALGISVGYLADSGFELSEKVFNNDIAGWTVAALLPIPAFGVLIHNAARVQTLENVDFAIGFVQGKRTLSWQLKYCAGIYFGLLLIPSVTLMLLNSSAASVMIRVDFKDYCNDNVIEKYIAVFRWGFVWLANLLMIDIERYIFTQWAANFGTVDAKKIAHFDARINNIAARLSQWKHERLQNWLVDQTPVSRIQLLNISEQQYQQLSSIKYDEEQGSPSLSFSFPQSPAPKRQPICEWVSSLFWHDSPDSSYRPLAASEQSDTSLNLSLPKPSAQSWWNTICC